MATEIERKFLVRTLPDRLGDQPPKRLQQGYLAVAADSSEARIRRSQDNCALTVKQGAGLARSENEIPITPALFDMLWPATAGKRIEKTRYRIPHGSLTIELDCYHGSLRGLVIAEVEFPDESEARAWTPPEWFGDEVTANPTYKNQNLALAGTRPKDP